MSDNANAVTVAAPSLGPMGRIYISRPCCHRRWALDWSTTDAKRTCTTCDTNYTIVVHDNETATVTPEIRNP